jgi:Polyketide cyclase / dehydrase and lipid transport
MSQLDVIDEGLIGAERAAVYDAIVTLMAGQASWWAPHLYVSAVGELGSEVAGRLAEVRIPGRARFVARIEEAAPPARLRVSYISGDFRGQGLWTFDAAPGGTRIRLHWQVDPTRWWLRWLASTVQRNHSRVMQIGFRALDAHLSQARAA